jgi:hypothetical protein
VLPIPRNVSDLTAAWLTIALGSRHQGVVVRHAEADCTVHGAATKVRLKLEYNEAGRYAGLPAVLWAKSGWEPHSRWLDETSAIDAREARFYADIAPLGIVNSPRCYFAAGDGGGRGIVLIEDLVGRNVQFGQCTRAATVDQVAQMLENFARLHARCWKQPNASMVRGLDVPMRRDTPSSEWPRANGPEVIAHYLDSARALAVPPSVKSAVRIDAAFWAMIDDMGATPHRCVLHGDAHPGNSFFDADGSPGLYDWQTLSFGPWAHDVSYYICSALGTEDRRRADRALLRHYLAALRAGGVADPPTFDEAWLAQRRYIAYGLHIWITNRIEFQSEDNCTAITTRLAAAAEDYDFFQAWGV